MDLVRNLVVKEAELHASLSSVVHWAPQIQRHSKVGPRALEEKLDDNWVGA